MMADFIDYIARRASSAVSPNLRVFVATRQLELWFVAIGIGIGVAGAAIAFRILIGIIQYSWLGTSSEEVIDWISWQPFWVVILAPTIGGLCVGLLLQFTVPNRRADGVADVIEAKAIKEGKIDPKSGILSALVSIISLGSGASAGREGPVVHLGATIGSWIAGQLQFPASATRTMLG
jgi:CIC family chloride channel protein